MAGNTERFNDIHWFPGHMMRTLRRAKEKMPLVDAVVQLLDARIPFSSINPALEEIYGKKPRLYVLNKSDLADEAVTKLWLEYFSKNGHGSVAINSKQPGAAAKVRPLVENALGELLEKRQSKGLSLVKKHIMVTGVSNVGKSTFINNWVGAQRTKTANKPGVTRGEQWVSAGGYELLDIPGVLPKRFSNAHTAINLALVGCMPSNIFNTEEMAAALLESLAFVYESRLQERFKLSCEELQTDGYNMLCAVARRRGMLMGGGEVDTDRASIMVLSEFRAGKLGKISVEKPPI